MGEYRKTFVNRIYTVGLTTCGSALVRIAGATESEGFQKVASFVNKWICGGNNTGQTLAEIQALCNEILNEVKIVDQHLKEYDAEIENLQCRSQAEHPLRMHYNLQMLPQVCLLKSSEHRAECLLMKKLLMY